MLTSRSRLALPCNGIGVSRADIPRIKKTLKMLEPTMLPTARSKLFFLAAITEVANSGREVPAETMVKAMILSAMPKLSASLTA